MGRKIGVLVRSHRQFVQWKVNNPKEAPYAVEIRKDNYPENIHGFEFSSIKCVDIYKFSQQEYEYIKSRVR